jgi:anti-sigma factor RsiW
MHDRVVCLEVSLVIDGCTGEDPRLAAWVDDELTPDQKKALAAHILLCSRCAREVGHMVAHKVLVLRPEAREEPPRALWPAIVAQLDKVDGLERALSPMPTPSRSRLPALVAIGVIMIAGALYLRSAFLTAAPAVTDQLLAVHGQALQASGMYARSGAMHAVANSYVPLRPHVTWQAIGKLNGAIALHRVCLAGRLPVSIITTPVGAVPLDSLERRIVAGRAYYVGATAAGAVVASQQHGLVHYVVASTTLEDLLPIAELVATHPSLLLP